MKRFVAALVAAAAAQAAQAAQAAAGSSVVGSKHDLSISGPGPIRALSEGNPCIFCHVSHLSSGESLLNRPDPKLPYQPYSSSTMQGRVSAPTGVSRVCLSCHDGTIAVGKTLTRNIATTVATIGPERRSHIGTDLRRSHPVSFRPVSGGRTFLPAASDAVRLDRLGELQCTTCHDPHREYTDPQGMFLVKPNRRSALCLTCHDPAAVAPSGSIHATSPAAFGRAEGNEAQFASVGEAGCAACHGSHGGEPEGRLVRKPPQDDDGACLRCHASGVTRVNLGPDVSKPYAHAGVGKGVHDAAETPGSPLRPMPELSPGAQRHVACVDCHDPHAAADRPALRAPAAGGALARVWGIDQGGQRVEQVQFEYEVCFKCHADSANKRRGPSSIRRSAEDDNLRHVFAPSSPSYHPVVAPGRNSDVPGLRAPYAASSYVYCTDCHASDTGPGNGGAGPRGPHGSSYPFLLERSYSTADPTPESPISYALCYKCHERDVLLADVPVGTPTGTGFRKVVGPTAISLHDRHVVKQGAPCSACHSAHGVSGRTGTPDANAHLVDFDLAVVNPGPGGLRRYRSSGVRSGTCNLTCHGKPHVEGDAYWSY